MTNYECGSAETARVSQYYAECFHRSSEGRLLRCGDLVGVEVGGLSCLRFRESFLLRVWTPEGERFWRVTPQQWRDFSWKYSRAIVRQDLEENRV